MEEQRQRHVEHLKHAYGNYTVNINKIKAYSCTVLQNLLQTFQCPNLGQVLSEMKFDILYI